MGRKRTACHICASIKTVCSQGRPCVRCNRLSLPCTYDQEGSPANLGASRVQRRQPKTGHTRSNGGCLNCRRRRKKCDEQHPTCGDCRRLGQRCTISQTTGAVSVAPPDHEQPGSEAQSSSSAASSPEWASAVANVFETHLASAPFADWIALIESEHRAGRVRLGSLANSAALADLPIPCSRDDEAGLATFLPPTALNNLTGVTPSSLKTWSFGQRHLLNHFLQSVSRALIVVDDEENPFLRIVVPMVLENALVRHGLLALSACHLSRVYPVFEQDLLLHRSLALQALRADIICQGSLPSCVVTTLLLCLAEVCEGHSRMWCLHLYGAKALLASAQPSSLRKEPLRSMLDLYNYICCVASVTSTEVPPAFEFRVPSTEDSIKPLFGAATSLYEVAPSVTRLAASLRESPEKLGEMRLQARDIEMSLQSWSPLELAGSSRQVSEARAAAFATQWALLLRLRQVMGTLRNDDPRVTQAANNILSALSLVRPGSEIEARILFPLFMAGVGSVTKPNRLTVEYRLDIMETTVGFGNISIAHRLLDELWRRSNDGETLDWEDLKDEKYPGLVLL